MNLTSDHITEMIMQISWDGYAIQLTNPITIYLTTIYSNYRWTVFKKRLKSFFTLCNLWSKLTQVVLHNCYQAISPSSVLHIYGRIPKTQHFHQDVSSCVPLDKTAQRRHTRTSAREAWCPLFWHGACCCKEQNVSLTFIQRSLNSSTCTGM